MRDSLNLEINGTTKNGGSDFSTNFVRQPEIDAYIQDHFKDTTANDAIDEFIASTDQYSGGRWTAMPLNPGDESVMYTPATSIVTSVLDHFGLSSCRKFYDGHSTDMPHVQGANSSRKLKTSPDIPLMGTGRSICRETELPGKPSYTQCLSWIECKLKKNSRYSQNEIQQATYARECCIQSNNRHFIHSLILTEESVQIWRFDRCGATYSDWINIHDNPRDFVRIILGISLPDEEFLGYDTSIFWNGDKRYVRTATRDGSFADYEILNGGKPFFFQRTLRGRATVCWKVIHKGRVYVVKDIWQATSRTPEYELLEEVRGMDGVGQLVAYDSRVERTVSDLRSRLGLDLLVGNKPLSDRAFRRVVLECYGSTIDNFHSRSELLRAFHDAVSGHRNLWRQGILHRDVSIRNILLGDKSSTANRGLLIDVDLATKVERTTNENLKDTRTGTWTFRSVAVLKGNWRHDYLDDLESFYYVLCWICFSFEKPHCPLRELPPFLEAWDMGDELTVAGRKTLFLAGNLEESGVLPTWFGNIFEDLLTQLHEFCSERSLTKTKLNRSLREAYDVKSVFKGESPLGFNAEEDYAKYLQIIETAMEKLSESDTVDETIPSPPATPIPSANPSRAVPRSSRTTRKRRSSNADDEDYKSSSGAKPSKRTRTVPQRSSALSSQSHTASILAGQDEDSE